MEMKDKVNNEDLAVESPTSVLEDEVCYDVLPLSLSLSLSFLQVNNFQSSTNLKSDNEEGRCFSDAVALAHNVLLL